MNLYLKNEIGKGLKGPELARINVQELTVEALLIPLTDSICNVIEIIPNSLVTNHLKEEVTIEEGCFVPSIQKIN